MGAALPQTNLQLYRLLIDRGANEASLTAVRKAYELALLLFGRCVRPSQKPFIAHLVGTAGALAHWNECTDVVVSGMLHSAYLFGDFRDGRRGAHPKRRRRISAIIGTDAESLIAAYSIADWRRPSDQIVEAALSSAEARALTAVKLADLWDEVIDCGPRYCPCKPLEFGAEAGKPAPAWVLDLARCALSNAAADDLAREFDRISSFNPPACLTSPDRSFHRIDDHVRLDGSSTVVRRIAATVRGLTDRLIDRWSGIAR